MVVSEPKTINEAERFYAEAEPSPVRHNMQDFRQHNGLGFLAREP
jgi:hypothetical protein